ncbi:MAG TPA: hypothetical protein PKE55_07515 [Kiritimatiellia bacterium]|nr:hypothetical protein [Kiritimatiellia bacterium]
MPHLKPRIETATSWKRLASRQAAETLRSVHLLDHDLIVKTFTIPLRATRYRTPWLNEDEALRRAPPGCAPAPLGWYEEITETHRIIRLGHTYIPGAICDQLGKQHAEPLARLLATLHRHGIVIDDAAGDNFITTPDGNLLCLDFGRAILGNPASLLFLRRAGRELGKLRRAAFGWDTPAWNAFKPHYYRLQSYSPFQEFIVRTSCMISVILRILRKTLKGKSPWS